MVRPTIVFDFPLMLVRGYEKRISEIADVAALGDSCIPFELF